MSRGGVKQARNKDDHLVCRYHTAFSKAQNEDFQWLCSELNLCPSETLRTLVLTVMNLPMSEFEMFKAGVMIWKN